MIPPKYTEFNKCNPSVVIDEPCTDETADVYENETIKQSSPNGNVHIGVDDLPQEMLIEIIRCLPLRDRKIAKLVCRRWADAGNDIRFARIEKLVLCGIYSFDKILEVLTCTRRTLLNIDFHDVNFALHPTPVWRMWGHKIRELKFQNCILNDSVVENVFLSSSNLSHLSLGYRADAAERRPPPSETFVSKHVIDRLLQTETSMENLKSLRIEIPTSRCLNNYALWGIFSVFPSITALEFACDHLEDEFQSLSVDGTELRSPHKLTFGSFLHKLQQSAGSMEKIDFHLNRFTSFTTEAIAIVCNLSRLKTLTLRSDDVRPWPSQIIADFVCKQRLLECVTIVAPFSETNEDTTKFFIHLLVECANLRHLEVRIDEMHVNHELFDKLARSGLKTLKMECSSIRVDAVNTPVEPNRTLQNLYLYELRRNGEVSSKFIETFRNLRYLYVRYVSDAVLEAIWKYQTDLRFLIFAQSESHRHNDDLFRIRRPGIHLSTSNLEYFEVETWYPKKGLVPDLIANYFPNLRYLNLGKFELYTKIDLESLEHLPLLEFLSLNFNIKEDLWYHSLVDLCSKLRNLRFLRIKSQQYSNTNFQSVKSLISDKGIVQELFACCPSIRIFIFSFWTLCGIEAYYCDVTEMKMKKIPKENEWLLDFIPNRCPLMK